MDRKSHMIVFLLFVRYAICRNCDCKLVDILRNIVQREMMEREMLVSRVEMLESKQGSGTNNETNFFGHSDTVVLGRISVIETMIENFNAELKEISKERQSGTRRNSALIEAWKVLKNGFSVMNEDVRKNIDDYNRRFSQLTLEVDKHIEAVDLKVELLINKTNDMVTKQLKTVGEVFEEIRFGLNKTFEDYTGQIDKDITVFINQTQSTLNEIIIDECASDPCRNGATCVDSVHNYTCICMAGFNGNHCQKEIDECSSGPCLSGATCVDGINSYSCRCQVGYMYVDKYCQDIDECVSGPCMNGATCEDGINSYACKCLAGYEGAHCQLAS